VKLPVSSWTAAEAANLLLVLGLHSRLSERAEFNQMFGVSARRVFTDFARLLGEISADIGLGSLSLPSCFRARSAMRIPESALSFPGVARILFA
jgi:hypothetical protein